MASKKPIAKKRTEKRATLIDILPYIFIIAVVPLIVHLYLDKLTPIEASNWTSGNEYADLLEEPVVHHSVGIGPVHFHYQEHPGPCTD